MTLAMRRRRLLQRCGKLLDEKQKEQGEKSAELRTNLTLVATFLFLLLVIVLINYEAAIYQFKRLQLEHSGTAQTTKAQVFMSDTLGRGKNRYCGILYAYSIAGQRFKGRSYGCKFVKTYPEGSIIAIVYDPADPVFSYPAKEGAWERDLEDFDSWILLIGIFLGAWILSRIWKASKKRKSDALKRE
jgi:hypothetical protein